MTLQEIAVEWLRDRGFDGLFNTSGGCACECADLMPCCEPGTDCRAGYKAPCTRDDCENGGECAFHIVEKKGET